MEHCWGQLYSSTNNLPWSQCAFFKFIFKPSSQYGNIKVCVGRVGVCVGMQGVILRHLKVQSARGGQQTCHVFQKGQSITPLFLRSERALHNTTLTTASPTRFSHIVCVDSRPRIARQVHRGQNLLTFAGKSLATQHKPYRMIYQYFNIPPFWGLLPFTLLTENFGNHWKGWELWSPYWLLDNEWIKILYCSINGSDMQNGWKQGSLLSMQTELTWWNSLWVLQE